MLAVVGMATVQGTHLFASVIVNVMIVEIVAVTLKMFVLKVRHIHYKTQQKLNMMLYCLPCRVTGDANKCKCDKCNWDFGSGVLDHPLHCIHI